MASFSRVHFDWKLPFLPQVADQLLEWNRDGASWDLREVVLVLPAAAAMRRLSQLLIEAADREGLDFQPPVFTTVGALPEMLYINKRPFVSESLQLLVWWEALRSLTIEELTHIVSVPPPLEDTRRWFELANFVNRAHRELASDMLDFADVVRVGEKLANFPDRMRWEVMQKLQVDYLRRLDELGFWDRQTARTVAIRQEECQTDKNIVLVGCVDLNNGMREMLKQIRKQVSIFQFGAKQAESAFDDYGCLAVDYWRRSPIHWTQHSATVVPTFADAANETFRILKEWSLTATVDEISIGCADADLASLIERRSQLMQAEVYVASGRIIGQGTTYKLLQALTAWIDTRSYEDFAAIVRHPLVYEQIVEQTGSREWLVQFDDWQNTHFPIQFDPTDPSSLPNYEQVAPAANLLAAACAPLLEKSVKPIGKWGELWLDAIRKLIGHRELDRELARDHFTAKTLSVYVDAWSDWLELPQELGPKVDAATAQNIILKNVQAERHYENASPNSIPLLGWLELPLDDASHVVLAGMNEGLIPSSEQTDLFLPNQLRQELGVMHSSRRYARDAYYFASLSASKKRMHIIVPRRNASRDPILPSRLLFAASPMEVTKRAENLFGRPVEVTFEFAHESQHPIAVGKRNVEHGQRFVIPEPLPARPITAMTATQFRDYLRCPYRFYLQHVMNLQSQSDETEEMDPGQFGTFLHRVLEEFGRSKWKDSENDEKIRKFLHSELDKHLDEVFSKNQMPAIAIQGEHIRQRLSKFAEVQAARRADGWMIYDTERADFGAEIKVGDRVMKLKSRIDRIDYHQKDKKYAVLDYKTGDRAKTPKEQHQKSGTWIDLQLPIYHFIVASSLDTKGELELGFFNLPKDLSSVGISTASWGPEDLSEAMRVAEEVVRNVLDQKFWPPKELSDFGEDTFGAICQNEVFERFYIPPVEVEEVKAEPKQGAGEDAAKTEAPTKGKRKKK